MLAGWPQQLTTALLPLSSNSVAMLLFFAIEKAELRKDVHCNARSVFVWKSQSPPNYQHLEFGVASDAGAWTPCLTPSRIKWSKHPSSLMCARCSTKERPIPGTTMYERWMRPQQLLMASGSSTKSVTVMNCAMNSQNELWNPFEFTGLVPCWGFLLVLLLKPFLKSTSTGHRMRQPPASVAVPHISWGKEPARLATNGSPQNPRQFGETLREYVWP